MAVADFEANAALDGIGDGLELEVISQTLCKIKGNEFAFGRIAGMLEGLFVNRAQGEQVVVCG